MEAHKLGIFFSSANLALPGLVILDLPFRSGLPSPCCRIGAKRHNAQIKTVSGPSIALRKNQQKLEKNNVIEVWCIERVD